MYCFKDINKNNNMQINLKLNKSLAYNNKYTQLQKHKLLLNSK